MVALACYPLQHCLRNYMGGALCYVAREYAGRVKIILRSWRIANNLKDPDEPWADWRPVTTMV